MEKVVSLYEYKVSRQYQNYYGGSMAVNSQLDTVFPGHKEKKDIRKEMIRGYMALLSNQVK